MKVLIVDDNSAVRQLVRDYLPESADQVYECADGSEALGNYKRYKPDWVLMDQAMPGMDGITAIREIIVEFPKANICMVTAFDDSDLRSAAFSAGAAGFVVKDNLSELRTILTDRRYRSI